MSAFRLALSNLLSQPDRTLVSLVGVSFAVLLVFMQLGFLGAVINTATLVYDQLDYDVMVLSADYVSMNRPASFDSARLTQARALGAVKSAWPVTTSIGHWRAPSPNQAAQGRSDEKPRKAWSILILALDPDSMGELFRQPLGTIFIDADDLAHSAAKLKQPDKILMDRSSRREYGNPRLWQAMRYNEVNHHNVEIIGDIRIGTGFGYNGLMMTSEQTLRRILPILPPNQVNMGLLRLHNPDDAQRAAEYLRSALPPDVMVLSRSELQWWEQKFWLTRTPTGQFFAAGVFIALVVGGIFVYQMMAADISKKAPEYATIRAMGYPGGFLSRVVYSQGILLALFGYVPGLLISAACYQFVRASAGIPIRMTVVVCLTVFALTMLMCMGSALVAVRKAQRLDPAELF